MVNRRSRWGSSLTFPWAVAGLALPALAAPADSAPLVLTVKAPDYRLEYLPKAYANAQRPLVLALGGGAAKGIAHLGVLQRLEEEGLPIDGVAGTSMGAFMGSMYVSGYSGFALQRLFEQVDVGALLMDRQQRLPGSTLWEQENERTTFMSFEFLRGEGLRFMPGTSSGLDLKRALQILLARASLSGAASFDELRVPFRAVSADLQAGRASLPNRGDLATAVRASMSIPGVFSPVLMEGHQHVDGMLVQNLPVEAARTLPVQGVVLAVEVGQSLDASRLTSILALAVRSLDVTVEERTEISRKAADILLRPPTADLPYLEFHQMVAQAVAAGRQAFDANLDLIEARIYGSAGDTPFPGGPVRVEAPEPLRGRIEAIVKASMPSGPRCRRHALRVLRRIHAAGLARSAVWLPTAEGPVLRAEPHPPVRDVEILGPEAWTGPARAALASAGIRQGEPFNPAGLGRALDAFMLEATIRAHPLVAFKEVRFDPERGLLRVDVEEWPLPAIRVLPGALSAGQDRYLDNLLQPFAGRPVDLAVFSRRVLLGEKRLGLEEIRLERADEGAKAALAARAIPDNRTIVEATLGYETTWQGHADLKAKAHRIFDSSFGLTAEGRADRLWTQGGLSLTHALPSWPRLGLAVAFRHTEQHLIPEALALPFRPDPRAAALVDRTVREQSVSAGVSVRIGMDDRGLVEIEGSRGWTVVQPADPAEPPAGLYQVQARVEWDSFDRYLFPSKGLLLRARLGEGRAAPTGAPTTRYRFAYLRARALWPVAPWASLDTDLEGGLGWDLPLARLYSLGGPGFLAGTASAGAPVANFAVFRLGLPLHVARVFGINVQAVPRFDAGYVGAATPGALRQGAFVRAAGLALRAELGRTYLELDAGRCSATGAGVRERTRVNVLLGTHPFDLWRRR